MPDRTPDAEARGAADPVAQRAAYVARVRLNVPAAMAERRQWLLWRAEDVGRKKPAKVPRYVDGAKRSGDLGGEADRARLATLDVALERYEKAGRFDGVGFAFMADDGLVGIDLDGTVDADTGELRMEHEAVISGCASYTERSPSGRGVHIICSVAEPLASFKSDAAGVEVYAGGRYFTVTGDRWEGAPIEVRPLPERALAFLRLLVNAGKTSVASAPVADQPPPPRREVAAAASATMAGDDFRRVNDAALQSLRAWVPQLFPQARAYRSGYRVSSKALGRDLEEDLQLLPEGVHDFGEERGMSPIDVVLRWGPGMARPLDAMRWLAHAVGVALQPPPARRAERGHLHVAVDNAVPIGEEPEHVRDGPPPEPPADGDGGGAPRGGGGGRRRRGAPLRADTINELLEHFALVYGTDTVWDNRQRGLMQVKNLRLLFGAPYVNAWLSRAERWLLMPEQIVFEPGGDLPEGCVNLFDGLPTVPTPCTEADVEPMLELLHHLCKLSAPTAEGVETVKRQVLQWCAAIVQRPGIKLRFAIVMHGPQGTGKNLFADAFTALFGRYGGQVGQSELEDKYNGFMSGKLVLVFNEVNTSRELFHSKNKIKVLITEPRIAIRSMYSDVRWESNHCNLIFLSNEIQPVALEWGDRRHLVIYTPAAEDPDLYRRVGVFLRDGGHAKWMHYLQGIDLEGFHEHSKPVMTAAKEALIELGLWPAERFASDWLGGVLDLPVRPCSAEQLFRVYVRWCHANGERDFRGQAMFTRTVERYVRERASVDRATGKRGPPRLVYKQFALDPGDGSGSRRTVRCWLPHGTGPANGETEGRWAWQAISDFERDVQRFTSRGFGGEE